SYDNSMDATGTAQTSARQHTRESEMLIALTEGAEFFRTPSDEPYVRFERAGHHETWPLGRGSRFKDWLIQRAHKANGKIPGEKALNEALSLCRATAVIGDRVHPVYTRVGGADGKVYLDLGDPSWRVIEIDADGWRIVEDPPVRFRRPK